MIGKELLKSAPVQIVRAIDILNHSIGSSLDIQILICGPEERLLKALHKQGGNFKAVLEARLEAGLKKISLKANVKIVLDSWLRPLEEKKGVTFVFLNNQNRMKATKTIDNAIQYVQDLFPEIAFDKNSDSEKNDFFLCYLKEEAEDPSEKILELQEEKPETKKRSTSKRKKNEAI